MDTLPQSGPQSTPQSMLEKVVAMPAAVQWFDGLFDRAHLEVADTGDQFTIVHHGDSAEVLPGLQGDNPNFVVAVQAENVANLLAVFEDGEVTPHEEYRIVKFMLQPCLEAALRMPILSNEALRRVVRIDSLWQEALLDPDGNEDEQLTAIRVDGQWLVIPGYHGTPQRRLLMTPAQALEFQRRLFAADSKNSLPGWMDLARWYSTWRETVTVPVNGATA